jgi:sugar transferase (PEP-CTERM/EpsH1 system associated)
LKVLFLSQRVPFPPDRGDRITTHHIVRHFVERGDRVTALSFTESDEDDDSAAALRAGGATVITDRLRPRMRRIAVLPWMATSSPLTIPYFRSRKLLAAVARIARDDPPDLCFAYSSSMAQYLTELRGAPRIQHFAELDSDKWRQYAARSSILGKLVYGREAERLLAFETRIARTFDLSLVVSEVEKELFLRWIPGANVEVLPNGVDSDRFAPLPAAAREPATVVFTGVMSYEPNVDAVLSFVAKGWPAVVAGRPEARLLVVGRNPTPAILALHGRQGIEVTGAVADTRPFFARASVAVAPLWIARGIQNKVLEAMSMALPVVASPAAAQGIRSDAPLVVADSPERTAQEVLALLARPEEALELGRASREFVRAHYRWEAVLRRLDELVRSVTTAASPPA